MMKNIREILRQGENKSVEEIERAYQEFNTLMDDEKCREAYEIFLRTPDLVDFASFASLAGYYTQLKLKVGREEAKEFQTQIRRQVDDFDELADFERLLTKTAPEVGWKK